MASADAVLRGPQPLRSSAVDEEDAFDAMVRIVDRGRTTVVVVQRSGPFDDFGSAADMDEVEADFETVFHTSVEDISSHLGSPRFVGRHGSTGFPEWVPGRLCAVWVSGEDRPAFLALVKEGTFAPFELRVGLR